MRSLYRHESLELHVTQSGSFTTQITGSTWIISDTTTSILHYLLTDISHFVFTIPSRHAFPRRNPWPYPKETFPQRLRHSWNFDELALNIKLDLGTYLDYKLHSKRSNVLSYVLGQMGRDWGWKRLRAVVLGIDLTRTIWVGEFEERHGERYAKPRFVLIPRKRTSERSGGRNWEEEEGVWTRRMVSGVETSDPKI